MAQSYMNRDLNRGDGDGRERPQYRSRSDRTHSTQNFENENAFRFNRGKEGDQDWKTGDYTDDDYRFDNSQHVNYGERYGSAAYGRAHYDPGMNRDFVDPRDAERQSSSESWRSDRPFTNREQDYRGRGPKNYSRTDERIRDEVCERLTEAHDVDPSEVEVVVASGEVTLRGTISDRSMKRRAERLAESVMGVQDVHNELRLGKSQGSESSEVATTSSRSGGGKPAKSPNSPM